MPRYALKCKLVSHRAGRSASMDGSLARSCSFSVTLSWRVLLFRRRPSRSLIHLLDWKCARKEREVVHLFFIPLTPYWLPREAYYFLFILCPLSLILLHRLPSRLPFISSLSSYSSLFLSSFFSYYSRRFSLHSRNIRDHSPTCRYALECHSLLHSCTALSLPMNNIFFIFSLCTSFSHSISPIRSILGGWSFGTNLHNR